MKLKNKNVVVTGGNGGIGTAICRRLKKEGANVISTGITKTKQKNYQVCDVTNEKNIIEFFGLLKKKWKKLDVLVNAAGIEIEKTIENTSLNEWNKIFAVNVTGTFLMSKYALPLLKKSKSASIINIGSYDGFIADPNLAAYCATKGAVHALTKAMAVDHGPQGIRVNAVCPGYIDTPMLQKFFDAQTKKGETKKQRINAAKNAHPIRTYGKPEDVANLVNWLASDEAQYASGQLWIIDGGLSAQIQQMKI